MVPPDEDAAGSVPVMLVIAGLLPTEAAQSTVGRMM